MVQPSERPITRVHGGSASYRVLSYAAVGKTACEDRNGHAMHKERAFGSVSFHRHVERNVLQRWNELRRRAFFRRLVERKRSTERKKEISCSQSLSNGRREKSQEMNISNSSLTEFTPDGSYNCTHFCKKSLEGITSVKISLLILVICFVLYICGVHASIRRPRSGW